MKKGSNFGKKRVIKKLATIIKELLNSLNYKLKNAFNCKSLQHLAD